MLPFAEDETIAALERNITEAGSVTDMLAAGMGVADITARLLQGLGGQDTGFQLQPRCAAPPAAVLCCAVLCWEAGSSAGLQLVGEWPGGRGACRCSHPPALAGGPRP